MTPTLQLTQRKTSGLPRREIPLYAIELGKPSGRETVIHSFSSAAEGAPKVDSVNLLGVDGMLTFHQQPDGLHIELPTEIQGKYAYAFRILPVRAGQ